MSKTVQPHSADQVVSRNELGDILEAYGNTVPTDATAGYAKGAIFHHLDGSGSNDMLYYNVGTRTSSNFDALSTSGGLDLSGLTATAAEINGAADVSGRAVTATDAASYTVAATDSGKTIVVPNFTATCTIALPAASAGLEFTFVSKAVAADAQDWKIQSPGAYLGGVLFLDTDDPADTVIAVFPNGTSNDFLNVVTPSGGTRIHVICDGTNYIANGIVVSATTPAFADT